MLKKELAKELEGYDFINKRMMMIQLKHMPDSPYCQGPKDEPLSSLQQQLNKLPRKNKKIILEDFNGKVGTNGTDTYPENCGIYGLGLMNNEGERLINFCALNELY